LTNREISLWLKDIYMHPRILAWPALLCALVSASVNAADKPEPLVLPAIIITAPAPEAIVEEATAVAPPIAVTGAAQVQP
jgi:hypothetical protein